MFFKRFLFLYKIKLYLKKWEEIKKNYEEYSAYKSYKILYE